MRVLHRLTLPQKILLVIFGAALLATVSSGGTVHAADEVQNQIVHCGDGSGVNSYNEHDYAGMIVEMQWKKYGSNTVSDARGTWAVVSTILPTSSNGGNLYNAGSGSRAYQGTFSQLNNRCGRASVAVFGYGTTSQRRTSEGNWTAGPWTLDCDVSFHGRGNEQRFNVTGEGVPDGAKPGGSWNTVEMRSRNGYTKLVTVTYTEPKPEPQNWHLTVTTQAKVNNSSWTKNNMNARAGATAYFRYRITNDGEAKSSGFQRWRNTDFDGSHTVGSRVSVDALEPDRSTPWYPDPVDKVNIPANAVAGTKYCVRGYADRISNGSGNNDNLGNNVCVTVVPGACDPCTPCGVPPTCPPPPNWQLIPASGASAGYVEQGGSVDFGHNITNVNPDPAPNGGGMTAEGLTGCVAYNYDPGDPNAGTGGINCKVSREIAVPFTTNPPGPYIPPNDGASVFYTNGQTPRGAIYCQAYSVSREARDIFVPKTSNPACAVVVGGTSSIRTNNENNVTQIEPGESANLTATISTKGFVGGGGWPGYTVNCNYNVTANGSVIQSGSCAHGIGGDGDQEVARWGRNPAQEGDLGTQYCLNVFNAGTANPHYFTGQTQSSSCFRVVARPYFKVYGGDVVAGCAGNSSTVIAWNKNGAGGTFNGAGASLAVFAQGVIRGFASGQTVPSGNAFGTGPTNLSFANGQGSTISIGGGIINGGAFGGNLNAGNCKPDYFASMPTGSDIVSGWPGVNEANRAPVQNFYVEGNINDMTSLAGEVPTVTQNSRIRLYVKGDVFISKDIVPSTTTNDAIEKIPSITVVARNIYIGPNVGQLYGTYVAQQDSSGGGNIYTCASGIGSPLTVQSGGNPNYNTCKQKQLVFTGSVVAKKIHLLRTWGSLYQDGGGTGPSKWGVGGGPGYNAAGEVFRFNPLVWQRESTGGPETGTVKLYDSITTLPPAL